MLLLLAVVQTILLLGTHLSGASAVDKDVAPVGDVKTDLLSLEQEIGGSSVWNLHPAVWRGRRRRRGIFFSGGITGFPFLNWANGYPWSGYPGYNYYGYYGQQSPGYYGYGSGYYPGYLGLQKIIIG